MIALLLALAGTARAGEWTEPRPYVRPILNIGYVSVNGQGTAQGIGGAEAGFVTREKDGVLLDRTRAQAVGMYGFTSGSLGGDLRVGSFIGPDTKAIRLLTGPDLFYNGYGVPGAPDYFLAWSPGLDIRNTATLKVAKGFRILGHVVPGWAFHPDRAAPNVPVFTHVNLGASARVSTPALSITVGVERQVNAAGTQDFIVLGAAI